MTKVGELLELSYGRALKAPDRTGGPVPVVGSGGVIGHHSDAITEGPTIVVGRKGSIGSVTWVEGAAWPIDTAYFVSPVCKDLDARWTYWMLQSLGLPAMNKSAAVPGLNRDDVYRLEISVPKFDEQQRIAAILDHADTLRAKRRQVLARHGELTQAIFIHMFGDPAKNVHGFPELALGDLADRFSDGPFGSNLKRSHYLPNGARVIRLQNIGAGQFVDEDAAFISLRHFESLRRHHCESGDIMIATLGDPNLRACLVPEGIGPALNKADCVQMRVRADLAHAVWVCSLLNMPGTLARARYLLHGQTRTRISSGQLRELRVPVPPIEEQRIFVDRVTTVDRHMEMTQAASRSGDKLFASLQSRAFNGQL